MIVPIDSDDDDAARNNQAIKSTKRANHQWEKCSTRHQSIGQAIDRHLIPELTQICLSYLSDDRIAVAVDNEILIINVNRLISESVYDSVDHSDHHFANLSLSHENDRSSKQSVNQSVQSLRATLVRNEKKTHSFDSLSSHSISQSIYHSIKTKSVIHRLHIHDNRLVTISHNEKVIRLHSINPSSSQFHTESHSPPSPPRKQSLTQPVNQSINQPNIPTVRTGTGSNPSSPSFGPINQSNKQSAKASVIHLKGEKTMTCLLSMSVSQSINQANNNPLLIGFEDGSIDVYNTHTGSRMYSVNQALDQSIKQMIAIDKEFPTSALSSLINRSVNQSLNQTINQSPNHIIVFTNDRIFRLVDLANHRIARFIGKIDYIQSVNQSVNQSVDQSGRIAVMSEKECAIVRLDSITRERTISEQSIKQTINQTINQQFENSIDQFMFTSQYHSFNESTNQLTFRPVCFSYLWSKLYAVLAVQSTDQSIDQSINHSINFLQIWRIGTDRPLDCMASVCADQSKNQLNNQSIKQLLYMSDGKFLVCTDDHLSIYQVVNQSTNQSISEDEPGPHWQDPDDWQIRFIDQWRIDGKTWTKSCLFLPAD